MNLNHQLKFKKLALSALLVSAVAVPTVTNAASEPKEVSSKVLSKTSTNTSVTNVLATVTTVARSWANPLDLAKTYAPTTLEDWKKTLEQYKKVVGDTNNVQYSIDMDKAGINPDQAFEIATLDSSAVERISATQMIAGVANNMEYTIDMDKAGIKLDEAFEINLDKAMTAKLTTTPVATGVSDDKQYSILMGKAILNPDQTIEMNTSEAMAVGSTMALPLSEGDQAFFKAQISLNDAAKSKDAAVIKEALAKLLIQYKQQIAEFTTAK